MVAGGCSTPWHYIAAGRVALVFVSTMSHIYFSLGMLGSHPNPRGRFHKLMITFFVWLMVLAILVDQLDQENTQVVEPISALSAAPPLLINPPSRPPPPRAARKSFPANLDEENPSVQISSVLLVQADEGIPSPVVDLIDGSTATYREEPAFL
ncbi:hypothetical protein F511_41069 [Dorcoceras hygrometricum]|uniref:Uncharacterized protein n=1 Tax=Dorcoceras hygrometricum TaxID=472368 RepID=A0A2Z7D2A2_9LAMI|nr:hypothetical protein F511_41069 [Dorcoceras hygrometricum]